MVGAVCSSAASTDLCGGRQVTGVPTATTLDANDAEEICQAMSRPNMRFVSIKSVAQQDTQAVHRIRTGLMEQRTAKVNQIRGLVAE